MEITTEPSMNMFFSFVMPAYKARFLSEAIDSILKQTYQDFELVIVDDASPENLHAVVDQFTDSRIRYAINEKNIGGHDLVENWNHCLQMAKGEYVILATDDDMFEADFLSDVARLIEKYPDADLIRSGVKKIDEKGKVLDEEFPLKEYMTPRELALFYAKGGTISCVSNYVFRKSALDAIGGFVSFPRAHYSDDATALALSIHGVACVPFNHVCFRVSGINLSNQTSYKVVFEQIRATRMYMAWYRKYINQLDTIADDYFKRACYGGYKGRYIAMIENLTSKIPLAKAFSVCCAILSDCQLFRKEKCKLILWYFINKL